MDIMSVFLLMARQAVERLTQCKVLQSFQV